jgi:hypothetical protein
MMPKPELLIPITEVAPNIPLLDQIPEMTPVRNAYGDLDIDPTTAGPPETTYGSLLLTYDLLTAERPRSENEARRRQDTMLDDAQRPFFDIVVGLQSRLSQDDSPTVVQDMIAESRESVARMSRAKLTLGESQVMATEAMKLYLLTLLKGDPHTYKKVGSFLERQHDNLLDSVPADKQIMAQADRYITRPWAGPYPFTYRTTFGFDARDDQKLARYYAMRITGGLSTALTELAPHAKTIQELTQQTFIHCATFDVKRKAMETASVEWQLLPPGDLRVTAQKLITEARERRSKTAKPLEVDLDRLQILEEIRKAWGPNTRYTRGMATGRRSAQTPEGEDVPNDYIVLVLQETNAEGEVVREHAVADSPITENGLFVYRQDALENGKVEDWSVAFSLPKPDAVELGARRLNHPPRNTPRMAETMAQKAIHLLTCPPEQFTTLEFHGANASGDVKVRNPRQKVARPAGSTALYAQMAAGLRELETQYF